MTLEEYKAIRDRILDDIDGVLHIDGMVALCDVLAVVIAQAAEKQNTEVERIMEIVVPMINVRVLTIMDAIKAKRIQQ